MLKNYMKEGQKLPIFGIGPQLMLGIALLTALAVIGCNYIYPVGILEGNWIIFFRILGSLFVIPGLLIWFAGAIGSDIDNRIANNKLKTDGIFARVRNPVYSGLWFAIGGVSFFWHNYLMLLVFVINWIIMTVVVRRTEEKWLQDLYKEEYLSYKKRVNRFIPWKMR